MDAAATPPASITITVLLTLLAIFAASWMTFFALLRRWTSDRAWVALSDWGREAGFRFKRDPPGPPPEPLARLASGSGYVRVLLWNRNVTLLRFDTAAIPSHVTASATPDAGAASSAATSAPSPSALTSRWHLLLRELDSAWPPTGLRPSEAARSVLDLFPLSGFPLLGSNERFTVYGTDSAAAASLAATSARGLLPPDIGLLLHGHHLVLDFSSRPFDDIEFERMIAIAEQLVGGIGGRQSTGVGNRQ